MEGKLTSLASGADRLSRRVDRAQQRVSRLFSGLALGAGAIATGGLVLGARRMFQLGKAAEEARISIAGTMSALSNETRTFNSYLDEANELFDEFADRSIDSPATSAEFRQLYGAAAPGIEPLGLSVEDRAQFTQRAIGAGISFDIDPQQAGADVNRMLQGQAGVDNKTFATLGKQIKQSVGVDSTEAFNKLAQKNPAKVFHAINDALSSLDPALKAYGESTTGLIASANEMLNRSLRTVYEGLAEGLRPELEGFVNYMRNNSDKVERFAKTVGDVLGDGISKLGDLIAWTADHADQLVAVLGTIGTMKAFGLFKDLVLAGGGGAIRGAIGVGKSTHGITQMLLGMGGGSSRGGGSGGTGMMAAATGAIGTVGTAGAGAAAGGASLTALIPTLAIALPIVITLFAGLAAGALAVTGAWRELQDTQSEVADKVFDAFEGLMSSLDTLAQKMGHTDIFGLFWDAADFLGTDLLYAIAGAIEAVTWLSDTLGDFTTMVKETGATIAFIQDSIRNNPTSLLSPKKLIRGSQHKARQLVAMLEGDAGVGEGGRGEELAKKIREGIQGRADSTKDEDKNGRPPININNNITQHIQSQANPDSIALTTADVTGQKTRRSIQPYLKGL
ncbi:MAG: hypothetical protein U5L04_01685 [Trueperaceae bacterium]|nr:hypothetical protein [Trueperaceae bacterium]